MYQVVLLLLSGLALASIAVDDQSGAAAKPPSIRACSILTKELALKFTAANKKIFEILPPEEEQMGTTGTACEYGDFRLQVDPFPVDRVEQLRKEQGQNWTPVQDVGDRAYFHNNRNRYAELIVTAGTHAFTIQMSVPTGGTAESVRTNVIGLANAIVPKLR